MFSKMFIKSAGKDAAQTGRLRAALDAADVVVIGGRFIKVYRAFHRLSAHRTELHISAYKRTAVTANSFHNITSRLSVRVRARYPLAHTRAPIVVRTFFKPERLVKLLFALCAHKIEYYRFSGEQC